MSHRVLVLCRPELEPAFAAAGLDVLPAEAGAPALRALASGARAPDVGLLLVEDALHESLPEEVLRRLDRTPLPMLVPFPGPTWAEEPPGAAYVLELLRRAVGYEVRLP